MKNSDVDFNVDEHIKNSENKRKNENKPPESRELNLGDNYIDYKELWENAEDIFFLTDLKGNVIVANRAARELFGFERLNVLDVVDGRYHKLVISEIQKLIRSKSEVSFLELLCYTKDGKRIWIESKARPITKKGKVIAIHGIARDITDKKKLEEKLKESEEKFRKIFFTSTNFIAILDENGTFIEANPAIHESFGTNPIGKTLSELLPEKLAKSRLRKLRRVIRKNEEITFEDKQNGKEYLIRFSPLVLKNRRYCLAIAQDITELKRMNRLLMALNKINRLLVSEKSPKRIFNRTAKLLSDLKEYYSVWIGIIKNENVIEATYCDGVRVHPKKLGIDLPCFNVAMEKMKSIVRDLDARKEICPFYEQFSEHSCLILPMVVDRKVLGFVIIHSTRELPSEEERDLLETLAKDLAFANKSIELDKARRKAYRQMEKNIEEIAFLVDRIRNPLSIISGTAEIRLEGKAKEYIMIGVERINDVIRRLDKRWLESEKIRNLLKKY